MVGGNVCPSHHIDDPPLSIYLPQSFSFVLLIAKVNIRGFPNLFGVPDTKKVGEKNQKGWRVTTDYSCHIRILDWILDEFLFSLDFL